MGTNDQYPVDSGQGMAVRITHKRANSIRYLVILIDAVSFVKAGGGVLYLWIEDDDTSTGVSCEYKRTQLSAYTFNNAFSPVQVRCRTCW